MKGHKFFLLVSCCMLLVIMITTCNKDGSVDSNNQAPQAPTLSSPSNSAANISQTPTLSWNASSDATSYTLQVSTSSSFSSYAYNQSGLTSTSQQVSGLSNSTTYYWRVSATNNYGTSGWSSIRNFTTISVGTAPPIPTLSSPSNGATNVEIPLTLTWNGSSGAISYTLQVSTSSSFSSYVYNQSGLTSTSQQVSGLSNSTTYYWRVSATNSYGTSSWSSVWSFTTSLPSFTCGSQITYSSKTYNTVLIGSQCWLKENLDVGTMITSNSSSDNQTNNGIIEKYCYNNDPNNCTTYGGLYQWNEAMQYSTTAGAQGICPSGWHIPTYAELQTLSATVGGSSNALKAVGQGTGNGAGTNTSGFSALLAGCRDYFYGYFGSLGSYTYFWSSTEDDGYSAYYMSLFLNSDNVYFFINNKNYGFSVRCLKD